MSMISHFSRVRLLATPWTVARQTPLSMGFSRQEYWSGLPCPPPGDLPDPGIELVSLRSSALAGRLFIPSTTGSPSILCTVSVVHVCQSPSANSPPPPRPGSWKYFQSIHRKREMPSWSVASTPTWNRPPHLVVPRPLSRRCEVQWHPFTSEEISWCAQTAEPLREVWGGKSLNWEGFTFHSLT